MKLFCRAYNEGVAFSYEISQHNKLDSATITDENFIYNFPHDYMESCYDRKKSRGPAGRENELTGEPSYLGNEPDLEFFDNISTTWDVTKVLYAKIGEYGVIARKKGEEWFIGRINNDVKRTLNINLGFLKPGIAMHVRPKH